MAILDTIEQERKGAPRKKMGFGPDGAKRITEDLVFISITSGLHEYMI